MRPDTTNIENQVAVVTGGAGALGRAIAERLLRSGVKLSLWDRDGEQLGKVCAEFDSKEVAQAVLDISDAREVAAATDSTLATYGRLDILINNAGVLGPVTEAWRCEPEDWRRVLDINLTGAFLCARAAVPDMLRRGYGRIVNVASIQGKEGTPLSGAYGTAKAGMIAMTKIMGKELAASGITVNCVTPAAFEGAMLTALDAERRNDILSRIPMGRFCSTEEVAAMVAWVSSPDCSFSTGAVFDLSGGRASY